MNCHCIERGEQDPDCTEHGIVATQRQQIENLTRALYAKQEKIDALSRCTEVNARIAELEAALAAGDVVAHQLQYSQCPEVLEKWWKARGGRDQCTVCAVLKD